MKSAVKPSSSSKHLYYFPLSTIIVDGSTRSLSSMLSEKATTTEEEVIRKSIMSRSKSVSSASGSFGSTQLTVGPLYTNDSSSGCSSSPSQLTIDSNATFTEFHDGRSFTVPCIVELRDRFQQYLKSTSGNSGDFLLKLHKLMFLDEFYDPTRNRRKRIENCETLFRMCDQYLTLIHIQSKNSLSFSLLDTFPYLYNFEEMQKIQPDNSILKNHEYLVKWFRKQSENLKKYLSEKASQEIEVSSSPEDNTGMFLSPSVSSTTLSFVNSPTLSFPGSDVGQPLEKTNPSSQLLLEYLDENELKMLIYMLSSELEDYFSLFQKANPKFVKKWLEKNVKSLPNYIIDTISKKRKKYLHYHENYKLTEEDLNMKTILDSDFEFIQYLAEHTEDWKILMDSNPIIAGFKSKENYCKFTDMKMQKFVTTVNYSLENVLKTMFANIEELGGSDNMIESSEYHHYTEIDPSISKTCIGKCHVMQGNILWR
ncbi:predicted protein [Naegleria gruberi]|uniref:Predicted protein n=1 Tax=Naegleria gruberi TaxID=5762 RepID=D2V8I7_NAEGR|nr:uncharacterized protein NAEGRDRAFT_65170 [Naegleria gruberi]EFC46692.1 predicted protein [Naegleria gruberi]|eukprot:XP_002679436.1 predicted protein [Naegleria gruberi strain NEG-M]